jgi:hypothetical protein
MIWVSGERIEPHFRDRLPRRGRHATEDVVEIGERIDDVVLTGAGERMQDGRRPAATVTPEERVVPASQSLGAEHPLGEVIVHAQVPSRKWPRRRSIGTG